METQQKTKQEMLDAFASRAMNALIQRDTLIAIHELSEYEGSPQPPVYAGDAGAYEDVAEEAYCIAWAMIHAREKFKAPIP